MKKINKISIVGAGNVAYHLGIALRSNGILIDYVYSKNRTNALALAQILNGKETSNLDSLANSDLVLVCVPDDVVYEIINQIPNTKIAYTSGSVELKHVNEKFIGVFYPLQTFRKTDEIDIKKTPIFIESTDDNFQNKLIELAQKISLSCSVVNSEERMKYHLSAVILNNFTNHILYLSKKEAEKNGIDWRNLMPLLEETLKKNLLSDPYENQTGPAIRNDLKTIEKHLSLLEGKSKEIYQVITESIKSTYHD